MVDVKAGTILENAARIAGRDVGVLGVPDNWKALANMPINSGIKRIVSEKLPMMQRVELRRYRPDYDEGAAYKTGNEVWYDGDYWRLEADPNGVPGEGSAWKKLEMEELNAFIGWEQPWENTVIDRAGVDVGRFAYVADPKYFPTATPLKIVGMNAFGIQLAAPAPKQVYCKFVPEFPVLRFDAWITGRTYEAGAVVYLTETKDCYLAQQDVTEDKASISPKDDTEGYWLAVRIPGEFESYLTQLVASCLQTLDQGKQQSLGYAEQEFNRICELYHEGNGETRVRRGRFI